MNKDEIVTKIKEVIEELRPYLNNDGGDMEYIKYEDKTVFVKLLGVCQYCPHNSETLNASILQAIQESVPEVEDIICVNL